MRERKSIRSVAETLLRSCGRAGSIRFRMHIRTDIVGWHTNATHNTCYVSPSQQMSCAEAANLAHGPHPATLAPTVRVYTVDIFCESVCGRHSHNRHAERDKYAQNCHFMRPSSKHVRRHSDLCARTESKSIHPDSGQIRHHPPHKPTGPYITLLFNTAAAPGHPKRNLLSTFAARLSAFAVSYKLYMS